MASTAQIRQNVARVHGAWGQFQNLVSGGMTWFTGNVWRSLNALPPKRGF